LADSIFRVSRKGSQVRGLTVLAGRAEMKRGKEMIKRAAKKLFRSVGLDLRRVAPGADAAEAAAKEAATRSSLRGALRQLGKLGFRPRTVIDVGVAFETRELYEEFREAEILLIEPLAEFEPFLKKICAEFKAQYALAAAGEKSGTIALNVHENQLDSSSLFREIEGAEVDGEPREVPLVTIDEVCAERGLAGPFLMKVDVQGAELRVLSGAEQTLEQTEVVILEVTLFGTMIGGPQLADVVSYMRERGFVVYDMWGMLYRPLDGALAQVDMEFVRADSVLRKEHGFATPEQRKSFAWKLQPQR
jgi:FkbM family methyltransferase